MEEKKEPRGLGHTPGAHTPKSVTQFNPHFLLMNFCSVYKD